MKLILPTQPGYTAANVFSAPTQAVVVVVKRTYLLGVTGPVPSTNPDEILMSDALVSDLLVREADTALLKSFADWHVVGFRPAGITAASLSVNGNITLTATGPENGQNLFGYEPRRRRLGLVNSSDETISPAPPPFDFVTDANDLFHATRRSGGYLINTVHSELPVSIDLIATATVGSPETEQVSFSLTLPQLHLTPFIHVSGPDREARWCPLPTIQPKPDTLTVIEGSGPAQDQVEVLWRASIAVTDHPFDTFRKCIIEEAA